MHIQGCQLFVAFTNCMVYVGVMKWAFFNLNSLLHRQQTNARGLYESNKHDMHEIKNPLGQYKVPLPCWANELKTVYPKQPSITEWYQILYLFFFVAFSNFFQLSFWSSSSGQLQKSNLKENDFFLFLTFSFQLTPVCHLIAYIVAQISFKTI